MFFGTANFAAGAPRIPTDRPNPPGPRSVFRPLLRHADSRSRTRIGEVSHTTQSTCPNPVTDYDPSPPREGTPLIGNCLGRRNGPHIPASRTCRRAHVHVHQHTHTHLTRLGAIPECIITPSLECNLGQWLPLLPRCSPPKNTPPPLGFSPPPLCRNAPFSRGR